MKKILICLVALFGFSMASNAAIGIYEFETLEQEEQFKELSHTLRCPKCQNNTIGDSNAPLAQDLRQRVYEMTMAGKTEEEIVDFMIARYGNFVTYKPPLTLATSILWFGPLAILVFGFGLIVVKSRKSKAAATETETWDAEKEARLKALLDEENNGDKQ